VGHAARADRRQGAVLQDREVREQVELLEHHADLAPHRVGVALRGREVDAVDHDAPFLHRLEPVDAADQGGLARSRGAAHHDPLAGLHVQVDVAQHLEFPEPCLHPRHGDDRLTLGQQVGLHVLR